MGVMQHRNRIANRTPQGGGLTTESLTDTATDDDIMEHDSGEGPSGLLADVDLDYDETYGPFSTDADSADAYTAKEAREDASRYAAKPFDRSDMVRNVAQEWRSGVVQLDTNAEPYLLAGADPLRKSITIKNVSAVSAVEFANAINIGSDASVPKGVGSGARILRGPTSYAALGIIDGDEVTLTHTGEVQLTPGRYVAAPTSVMVTYVIERYYR
jgi:hypothetical protein